MPPSLRQLYRWALEVRSCEGVRTCLPERHAVETKRTDTATISASTKRAQNAELYPPLRRAMDVLITVEGCDSTGYLTLILATPDEVSQAVWERLPVALLCLECRVKRWPSRTRTRNCPVCGEPLLSYPEMIDRDEVDAAARLRDGGIRCTVPRKGTHHTSHPNPSQNTNKYNAL